MVDNRELRQPLTTDVSNEEPKEKGRGGSLLVVYFAVFVDMLGFGLIMPQLPLIAEDLFHATDFDVGVFTASYSIAQMFGSLICGILSDKIGRRPVLTFCLLGTAVTLVGMGLLARFSDNLLAFVMLRAADGAMSATIGISQAYIADITLSKERAKYMGLVGAASGLGLVAGPALGGLLSEIKSPKGMPPQPGFSFTCYVGAVISLVNFLLALILLKEPQRQRKDEQPTGADTHGRQRPAWATAFKDPNVILVFIAFMLAQLGFTVLARPITAEKDTLVKTHIMCTSICSPETSQAITYTLGRRFRLLSYCSARSHRRTKVRQYLVFKYCIIVLNIL